MDYTAAAVIGAMILVIVVSATVFRAIVTGDTSTEFFGRLEAETNDSRLFSTGTAQKYTKNGKYVYTFLYNLPITNPPFQVVDAGRSFNEKPAHQEEYVVYMGETKSAMSPIGPLKRFPDGYHKLTITSDRNYKYSCIVLGQDTVSCSRFI